MREICDRHGALLILDEVMCGMGRTGTMHAWEQEGITPDIQVVAKGLGGGYQPIGGILIAGRIVDAFRAGSGGFMHGHTYQAHPVACAAALEVQRVIRDDHLLDNVHAMGARLETGADRTLRQPPPRRRHPRPRPVLGDRVRHRPRHQAAVRSGAEAATSASSERPCARGLAIYPMGGTIDGKLGDHVIVAPPYIATAADIDAIVDRLGAAVDAAVAPGAT